VILILGCARETVRAPEGIMIKNKSLVFSLAALTVLLGASATFAQSEAKSTNTQTATKKPSSTKRMLSDTEFAKMAAQGGLAEVKLGQLAEEKGSAQTVKDFGKRMVTDHSKADDDLKAVASKDKISLPAELSAKDQAAYNRLSRLSGEAFDRAYARDMVRDHSADVAEFRLESKDGKNASIKDFASQKLPTLEDHLKQAREMLRSTSATNSNTTKKSSHSS
jgi:putative membrane protein